MCASVYNVTVQPGSACIHGIESQSTYLSIKKKIVCVTVCEDLWAQKDANANEDMI